MNVFTARNSRRWEHPEPAAAHKYLPRLAEQEGRLEKIRRATALRHSYRLDRACKVDFEGTPHQRGMQQILGRLYAVREAENLEVLLIRDRHLGGIIEGARIFGVISLREIDLLSTLRDNAFNHRHLELMP